MLNSIEQPPQTLPHESCATKLGLRASASAEDVVRKYDQLVEENKGLNNKDFGPEQDLFTGFTVVDFEYINSLKALEK